LPLRHPGMEPLDRLERSSPGYGPGTSPSTLERQRATGLPPEARRLADVRPAVCQRGLLPSMTKARASRRSVASGAMRPVPPRMTLTNRQGGRSRSKLQGSESNRRAPAHEAGSGANPPCSERAGPGLGSPPLTRADPTRRELQAAEELNLAVRFWRPARSQIAAQIFGVTARVRSGTFAFTARRAEPLHHGHRVVEAEGVAPSSRAYQARALLLSYVSQHRARGRELNPATVG
jgi:hypothetical protein